MTAVVAAETVVLVLLTLLVAGLLRSHAQILGALHDLGIDLGDSSRDGHRSTPIELHPPRGAAPERGNGQRGFNVTGVGPGGESVSVAVVGARVDTLLAFLSGSCTSCAGYWQTFATENLGLPDRIRLVIVTLGPGEESPARIAKLAPKTTPTVMSSETWADYHVPGAPYFVLVEGQTGAVKGEGSAPSWAEVRNLMAEALAEADHDAAGPTAQTREARIDADLERAGILPGDPRLHPPTHR